MPMILILGIFLIFGSLGPLAKVEDANAGIAGHLVINEVFIDSVIGTGGSDDDWVELYNPTGQAISLDGWSIQKTAGTGGSLVKQALSGTVPARGYFLIVRNGAATTQALKDKADLLAGSSFSLASDNIIYLANDNVNITDPQDLNIVDFVGYGTAISFEGSAAAPNIVETKCITRNPDGEDTDQNSVDFILKDSPTPMNSSSEAGNKLEGTVVLTVAAGEPAVQNISASGADIAFTLNADGNVWVNYGIDQSYGNTTAKTPAIKNVSGTVGLSGLSCGTTYHYSISAENSGMTESDNTADAIFATMPCGIALNSLTMTRNSAKANNKYAEGWEWEFNITVWDLSETGLKMKFAQWLGAGTLDAGMNMRYTADGSVWKDIAMNDTYPDAGLDISGVDLSSDPGRQVKVIVQMKVPAGTPSGNYATGYGILTE